MLHEIEVQKSVCRYGAHRLNFVGAVIEAAPGCGTSSEVPRFYSLARALLTEGAVGEIKLSPCTCGDDCRCGGDGYIVATGDNVSIVRPSYGPDCCGGGHLEVEVSAATTRVSVGTRGGHGFDATFNKERGILVVETDDKESSRFWSGYGPYRAESLASRIIERLKSTAANLAAVDAAKDAAVRAALLAEQTARREEGGRRIVRRKADRGDEE